MCAKAAKKIVKKKSKKPAVKRPVARKKAGAKKPNAAPAPKKKIAVKKQAAAKKKVGKTPAAAKKPVKSVAKKAAKKKAVKATPKATPVPKVAARKPLTAEEKKARVQERAAERVLLKASLERLLARRTTLIEAYHSTKGNTKTSDSGGTEDYIDYAVSSYERDFSLSLTELERTQLLLVEEALVRVRRKDYGTCLNCNIKIPVRRLEVEAWARYCIACQELDDMGLLEGLTFDQDSDDDDSLPADDTESEDVE